ncbi:SixA phosphatase family protein [Sinorhizobium fredii]|uniref:Histidine phosphatase family protein n=1 Tax=Rhizobium fredii TaxID=380 RepID=A0A844AFG5_RHIFR|nr:histidine phosphatase family protein [Sinorhizobium fredii]AWM26798.1 Phosphohistidine phosphatase SixA [Sinorhizobium fredii CCBAU 25509]KSV89396.1 phosphoglycerate mutase [Sinorhizobium fredii USDA 205]MQX10396.1 histidine phosphatase family protein [Sinorhizobium fredii]UTY50853.1 histidine phosphatase family protein [Sinorhizobium fredii]GEC31839.1 phosphoglycerate mutase [Sinorhizobium fredii]
MPDDASPPIRRLMLLRHAKSAWPEGVADHRRPLAGRGRKAAPAIGTFMARRGLIPDLALVSTARRAQETWELVAEALPHKVAARDAVGIYEVAATAIIDVIRKVEPSVEKLLLVGHNPGMAELALLLAGGGDAVALERLKEKFPTAGLAVMDFTIEQWSEIAPGAGRLVQFVTPRLLKDGS